MAMQVLGQPLPVDHVGLGGERDHRRASAARSSASSRAMNRSPGPIRWSAGRQKPMTSTSSSVSRTRSLSRWPSSVRGWCSPGVSTRISWRVGPVTMPRMVCRVVCGLLDVIATLLPDQRVGQRRLAGVRPADEAGEARDDSPAAVLGSWLRSVRRRSSISGTLQRRLDPLDDHGRDPVPATRTSVRRSGASPATSQVDPRIGTRPRALPSRPPTVSTSSSSRATSNSSPRSSTCSVAATRQPAVAEVLDLGRLAVVLVGDLADDLLEDVLDGDQARRCRRTRRRRRRRGSGRAASRAAGRRPACSRARRASAASRSRTGTARASRVARCSRRTTSLR